MEMQPIKASVMVAPLAKQFSDLIRRLPRWVLPLIIILLFGRFILLLVFHFLS
jgi:hypothetical protein